MAHMYPTPLPAAVAADPGRDAESRVYDALAKTLDDRFHCFYGVAWLARRRGGPAADGEADFVVAHPELGVLVLEVKGGRIGRDGATGEWVSVSRGGHVNPIRDPFDQARGSKYALLEKIKEQPGWRDRRIELGHGVVFPDCAAPAVPLTVDSAPQIVISMGELGRIGDRVRDVYAYWAGGRPTLFPLGGDGVAMLTRLLARSFVLSSPLGYELAAADRQILRLTEEQFAVLDMLVRQRRVAVSGGAGTGKTLLALEKAKRLAQEGLRVLLTCFNRPLAEFLRRSAGEIAGLEVINFHRLCYWLAKEARVPLADPGSDRLPSGYFESEMPEALLTALGCLSVRYDAIIVDEGQDFLETWWDPLQLCLADPDDGLLYVFHDDNQRIYRQVATFPKNLVEVELSKNLRNTVRIHEVARRFYSGPRLEAAGPDGRPVEISAVASRAALEREVGKTLHRLLREEQVAPNDVAVLTGTALDRTALGRQRRIGTFPVTNDQDAEPGKVLLETIHRFKGLERPVIVLTELEGLEGKEAAGVLYVGLSRARVHLIIVATAAALVRLGLGASPKEA